MDIPRTLLVTNDFPPRVGGIQRTLHALVRELPADRISVFAPQWDGAEEFDAGEPYRVVRAPREFSWPTPRVERFLVDLIASSRTEVVLFGATYPLAMLGPRLAERGIPYLAAAHGFEYWLSLAPGAHSLMRSATSRAARVVVMCSAFIARVVRTAVPKRVPVSVMYPGADVQAFHPDLPTDEVRARHQVADRPLVVCVSRLVPRKGQDVLIRAMPAIRRKVPDAGLLLVGGGPYRRNLERLATESPPGSVVFAGQVPEEELPRYYAAGDLFAMPCRNRLGGLEVEGWGNVFIEAAACGRAVVAGNSGGARESIVDGLTGILVEGADVAQVADAVSTLLADPGLAKAMGNAGRERVEGFFTWPRAAEQLAGWLREAANLPGPARAGG
ncbi:MAG: glycosyltransferase family 4 protein [Actinomycetota bacterium]